MNEVKLEPCPFCGCEGNIQGDDGKFFSHCMGHDCFCSVGERYDPDGMPDHIFTDPESAADAWNTRAAHPSHAAVEAMEQAAQTLADGMETCHVCRGTVLVEEGAVNCEDCSACCDDHEEPECPTLYDLHLDLKRKLAAYRATHNKEKSK